MHAVFMPKLGLINEGTILRWYKREGETVEKGEPLLELETEKVTAPLEAPASGVLKRVLVGEGRRVEASQLLAVITEPGEEVPNLEEAIRQLEQRAAEGVAALATPTPAPTTPPSPAPTPAERVKISPVARRLAEEHRVDITKVVGTGPGGRIVREDILRAVEEKGRPPPAAAAAPRAEGRLVPLTGVKRAVAQKMALSAQIPQFTLTLEADATELTRIHEVYRSKIPETRVWR